MEYNAAPSLNIRINIKFSISFFFHSWKTFYLLTYAILCHSHAEVDFEVISVPSIAEKCFDILGILKIATVKSVEPGNNILIA